MADTYLTLANAALQRLGAAPITALNCTTEDRAVVMNTVFERTLTASQRSHRWNFTQKAAALVGWICAPVFGYNCAFLIPDDALTVDETNLDDEEAWRLEMHVCAHNNTCVRVLVTDACSVSIRYTTPMGDPTLWDPMFRQAFVVQLAHEAAYPITRNSNLLGELAQEADVLWRRARSRDGQEGKPLKRLLSNVLLNARFARPARWFRD